NQSPAATKTDPAQTQSENADSANFINNESDLDVRTAYNPSDPFGFQPVQYIEPTSVRVFSGCFCTKKSCKAYDQQGTQISGIDPNLCKGLMDDSSNRPYNYFKQSQTAGNQTINQSQQQQSPAPQTEDALSVQESSA